MSLAELAKQRMTNPAKPKAKGDEVLENFLRGLTDIVVLGIKQKKEVEATPVIEYLCGIVKDPEGLKTVCATAYARSGRPEQAEALLRQVLADKPDYALAQIALAANLLLQKTPGSEVLLQRVLATSIDPSIREQAVDLMQIKSSLDVCC